MVEQECKCEDLYWVVPLVLAIAITAPMITVAGLYGLDTKWVRELRPYDCRILAIDAPPLDCPYTTHWLTYHFRCPIGNHTIDGTWTFDHKLTWEVRSTQRLYLKIVNGVIKDGDLSILSSKELRDFKIALIVLCSVVGFLWATAGTCFVLRTIRRRREAANLATQRAQHS